MLDRIAKWGRLLLIVVCSLPMVGCGGLPDEEPKSLLGPSSEQALVSLKDMLQGIEKEKAPMPRSIADLSQWGPGYPAAEVFLQSGEVNYAWGTKIDSGKADVMIAFEKNAPQEGGFVLMQDGTVKKVTAEEFAGLKFAGKKK